MFYSQMLENRLVENTCPICEQHFPKWETYHAHVINKVCERSRKGFMPEKEAIKPVRTSTRSKAQIVFDMEKTWGHAVIPTVKPWQTLGGKV